MSRSLLIALAAALAIAVPAAQASTSVTLVFTSLTTLTQTHDTAPKGKANKGDSIDFKDLLLATTANELGKAKGKPVAYDAGTVVYTSASAQSIKGVTTFPKIGTITFEGQMVQAKDGTVHVPITKGTGSFAGVKGTLIIGTGDQKAPNTYRLTLPGPLCTAHCA
ncbi:MAG TPA: hypothetical protein VGL76_05865 [Gaiellaceae bacterium]